MQLEGGKQCRRSNVIGNSCRRPAKRSDRSDCWRHPGRRFGHHPNSDRLLCSWTIETWRPSWPTIAYVQLPAFAIPSAIRSAVHCFSASTYIHIAPQQSRLCRTGRHEPSPHRTHCATLPCASIVSAARGYLRPCLPWHLQWLSRCACQDCCPTC